MTSTWQDPNPPTTDSRTNPALIIAGVGLTLVVVAALVIVVVLHRGDARPPRDTASLLATNVPGPQPFTPSAVAILTPDAVESGQGSSVTRQVPIAAERGVRLAQGTQPGLYGGYGQAYPCDASAVANHLDTHPAASAAWANVIGITPNQVPQYLNTLTPVVLTADTWVTSHRFADGRSEAIQTVLQSGTNVMVDPIGVPRVHCASGAPLVPPANVDLTEMDLDGDRWPAFDTGNVVAVAYSSADQRPAAVAEFSLVDITSGQPLTQRAGGTIDLGPQPAVAVWDPVAMNVPPIRSRR
ncbi:MAG: DUF6777 domain-containing protein [Actinomycetota bacterium]